MLCKRRIVAEGLDVNVPATEITCDPNSIFRTINGTCNNLRNPSLYLLIMEMTSQLFAERHVAESFPTRAT